MIVTPMLLILDIYAFYYEECLKNIVNNNQLTLLRYDCNMMINIIVNFKFIRIRKVSD